MFEGFANSGCRSGEIFELLANAVLAKTSINRVARLITPERFRRLLTYPINEDLAMTSHTPSPKDPSAN
jgi:hypothetical protein